MAKQDIDNGLQKQKKGQDPMKGVIDSDHTQAPRNDGLCDDVVLDRDTISQQDSGYTGPNEIDRSDISFEYRSRDEK
jgi:hypothetical protein